MREEVVTYISYLNSFKPVSRPPKQEIDVGVYENLEYIETSKDLESTSDFLESLELDIDYILGNKWK